MRATNLNNIVLLDLVKCTWI